MIRWIFYSTDTSVSVSSAPWCSPPPSCRVLTRASRIEIYVGSATDPEGFIGHMLFSNETHLIINCEDGAKVFLLRTVVTRIIERPLTSG